MRALLITKDDVKVVKSTGESDLEFFYKNIECDCIDIVARKVGGKVFEIVCDDEGLLKESPRPSAISKNNEVELVGNLMFFHGVDSEGDLIDITKDDVKTIRDNIFFAITGDGLIPVVRLEQF